MSLPSTPVFQIICEELRDKTVLGMGWLNVDKKGHNRETSFFRGGMAQLVRLRIKNGHNSQTRLF